MTFTEYNAMNKDHTLQLFNIRIPLYLNNMINKTFTKLGQNFRFNES